MSRMMAHDLMKCLMGECMGNGRKTSVVSELSGLISR